MAEHQDTDTQSLAAVCGLLADQRRQHILACLMDRTRATALADLAEDVAARESEKPRREIPNETVQTVSTSLYHSHIPKLVETGAVEYDQNRDQLRISENVDLIERVLSLGAVSGL